MIKTGLVHVIKQVPFLDQTVPIYRQAVLLREGDRYSLHDPANNNELARGMTASFTQMLLDRGWVVYFQEREGV